MSTPPRKGRGRPRRVPMDEETTSTPQAPYPHDEPQVLLGFQVLTLPQPDFFLSMTSEVDLTTVQFGPKSWSKNLNRNRIYDFGTEIET